ncbi:MAG: adenylate/guanylate cyclase domain-containing protein [Nitrososphaerota archaeon]|nr:adenylate/guanylate cyclase domain-containing protein [Nitrososphaerota archaeon]
MNQAGRRLAAVMFTDIVGYTMLGQKDEGLSLELLEEHRRLLRPIITSHNGREVKTIGDAFLVEFSSALDAVNCAHEIQNSVREHNSSLPPERRIHLRIGIHLGDVIGSGDDILGDAVNVASRVQSIAEDGGVCLTRQVYDHVKNKTVFPLAYLGPKSMKNVTEPIEVFKIVMPWEEEKEAPSINHELRRIAVLPFNNISPDPADAYISDGMTEELISTLSQVSGLKVISRTSVMTYKNTTKKLKDIARELNVGSVLEGSVRKTANKIRITVQLIDAITDEHLWVGSYDRELVDIFEVQGAVAAEIAKALEIRLSKSETEATSKVKTISPVAYQLYLAGTQFLKERSTEQSARRAIEYFQRAVNEDPRFADSYTGLAKAYERLGHHSYIPWDESYHLSRKMIEKALELDPDSSEAHAVFGFLLWNHDWKFSDAKKEFEKAIQLNPSDSSARLFYARTLAFEGDLGKARQQIGLAEEYDPLNRIVLAWKAVMLWLSGVKDEAFKTIDYSIQLDPSPIGHFFKLVFLINEERIDEAEREFDTLGKEWLKEPLLKSVWGYIRARKGDTNEAIRILEELKALCERGFPSEEHIANVYASWEKLINRSGGGEGGLKNIVWNPSV